MKTGSRLSVADVFVGIRDQRQAKKVEHDLVELLVIAVCGVLAGTGDFVEIKVWANEKCDWLRPYLRLEHGIPSHDTTRASPFSASVLKFYRFIPDPVFLLHIDSLPCRCEKVKDCGTTTGHVGLDARTLMKDARGGLIR